MGAKQKTLYEIRDLCAGAAFPFMIQLILSASIILFADYSEDTALSVFSLVFGEVLLVAAYIVFGRQNGIAAYRKTVQNEKKRELSSSELSAGEYAIWKGAVIGFITVIPFIIIELIQCCAPNTVCEFVLKYAFGWAAYPFILIGGISEWLNFIWIVIPVGVHLGAYIYGAGNERAKQQKVAEAQALKEKHRK